MFCVNCYCIDFSIKFSELLTILGALFVFIVTFCQYKKSQRWKRAEFVYQLYINFKSDFNVRRGMRMLDWYSVDIPLIENEIEGKNKFYFNHTLFKNALRNHFSMSQEEGFSDEEAIIRFVMDDFLEKLGLFYTYIKKKLISKKDIEPYLIYWISIICDEKNTSLDSSIRVQLWNYIITYKNSDVISLCKLFGYEIKK